MTIQGVNTKYSVLAHYTRHIREGFEIIDGGEANTVAAYNAHEQLLVLVTVNHDDAQTITHDLSRFASVSGPVTRWSTTMQLEGVKYLRDQEVKLAGKKFSAFFPANSIHTFEIVGAEQPSMLMV